MKVIKSIKTIILASILGLILITASIKDVSARPSVVVALKTTQIEVDTTSPGPRYKWVRGHYRVRLRGRMVWVPAHWRKK